MCAICGCSADDVHLDDHAHEHADDDDAHRLHSHGDARHTHAHSKLRELEIGVLAHNDAHAAQNRALLRRRAITAINVTSSPGAGKTSLLERTLRDLSTEMNFSVIEGDQETDEDARRIRATGCSVLQIETGTGCHLDAAMIERAIEQLAPPDGSVLIIENVGNLVCPALFDLGEAAKVLVASVSEGDEKPLKYPHMFRAASLVVLNKMDLAPHVPFDVARFVSNLARVNSQCSLVQVSALSGAGLGAWYAWLRERVKCHARG